MDLDFSGMFKQTPLEKAEAKKRLTNVSKSLTVLVYSAIVLFALAIFLMGMNWRGLLAGAGLILALFLNNYLMYMAAYRDGFRAGYTTAMEDEAETGFVSERIKE